MRLHRVGLEERLEAGGAKALAQCSAYARVLAAAHHIAIVDVVDAVGGQVGGYDPAEAGVLTQAEHHLLAVALVDLLDDEKAQPNAPSVLLHELAHHVDQFVSYRAIEHIIMCAGLIRKRKVIKNWSVPDWLRGDFMLSQSTSLEQVTKQNLTVASNLNWVN